MSDLLVEEIYKSCSPIVRPEESCYGADFEGSTQDGTVHFDICKTMCQEDNCNSATLHASPNNDIETDDDSSGIVATVISLTFTVFLLL